MGDKINLVTAVPKPTIEVGNKFTELIEPIDDEEFPIPNPVAESRVKHHMPRITRGDQKARNVGKCDADRMGNSEFGSLINAYNKQKNCIEKCCAEITKPLHEETTVNVPIIEPDAKDNIEFDGKHKFDPYNSNIATAMMANAKKRDLDVGPVLRELATNDESQINLLTMANEENAVLNVNQGKVWVQVPCAVDSGSCANVTPGGLFSLETSLAKLDPKFFGADGSPIANLGTLIAEGMSEEGINMKIDFDVANVTRPLLSVFKMTNNGQKVNFDGNGGSIFIKGSNKKVKTQARGESVHVRSLGTSSN